MKYFQFSLSVTLSIFLTISVYSCRDEAKELSLLQDQYLDTLNYEPIRLVSDIYSGLQRKALPDRINIMGSDLPLSGRYYDDSLKSVMIVMADYLLLMDIQSELIKKYGQPKLKGKEDSYWFDKNLTIQLHHTEYGGWLIYEDIYRFAALCLFALCTGLQFTDKLYGANSTKPLL